jgi:hypothetical protein
MKRTAPLAAPPSTDPPRFASVKIALAGRFMLADGSEHPCTSIDVSPGTATLATAKTVQRGQYLILYLDRLGRLEGEVQKPFEQGFTIHFASSEAKRRRLAEDLTWLANRDLVDFANLRSHARAVVAGSSATMRLEDGTSQDVTLIDVSLSGLGVRSDLLPPLGATIQIGANRGRVVRHFEGGFGLSFNERPSGGILKREKITSNPID